MFGFYRLAAASPELRVADPAFNSEKIIEAARIAERHHAAAAVFPELAVSGYTCADLFHQPVLLDKSIETIIAIAGATAKKNIIIIAGAPFMFRNAVYNCAFVLQHGTVKGIVPKIFNPNYREFYEKRWFKSGRNIRNLEVSLPGLDYNVPFGTDLIFESGPAEFLSGNCRSNGDLQPFRQQRTGVQIRIPQAAGGTAERPLHLRLCLHLRRSA